MEKIINAFPGYEHVGGKNMYRGVDMGYGGYVYAEPGIYTNVALLDVASMHPSSIIAMNCFGEYTKNFKDILDARLAIKHKDFDTVRNMFGGKLAPYLEDEASAASLAQALKIAINSVYGLTSAGFDNPFRDKRNKNNIVALRGALFMKTLQDEVQARGFTVAHIKTDSIKIPDATPEIIQFAMDFGKKYGYTFEHEATYEKMCLVNDAVYIAKYKDGDWTATGTQFAVPYVFKKLFSKEPLIFEDLCETKQVSTSLHLDMNETLENVSVYEEVKDLRKKYRTSGLTNISNKKLAFMRSYDDISDEELDEKIAEGHDYHFVGKIGQFCPIKPGCGGGILCRESKGADGEVKYASATGAKGYRWLESEVVKRLGKEDDIDRTFYDKLVDDAVAAISQYGDFEWFVSDDPVPEVKEDKLPWALPCGETKHETCFDCPHLHDDQYHFDCDRGYDVSNLIFISNKKQ